ncbi:MAG: hypothetical protein NVSMB65_17820 [Chloroflexota bacterium]
MTASPRPRVVDMLRLRDGEVWASQCLRRPVPAGKEAAVAARIAALDAEHLARHYAGAIGRWTHGLVRARYRAGEIILSLPLGGPPLLVLSSPASVVQAGTITTSLGISGGLAVASTSARSLLVLKLSLRHGTAPGSTVLEAEVLVEHYAPRVLALPLPRGLCRVLYLTTQAHLHRAITGSFVRELAEKTVMG